MRPCALVGRHPLPRPTSCGTLRGIPMTFRIFSPEQLSEIRGRLALRTAFPGAVHKVDHWWAAVCPFCTKQGELLICDRGADAFYHSKCCGAHGDVVGATMRRMNYSFQEAVERLSELAEIPV